jgi:hypothetical protein
MRWSERQALFAGALADPTGAAPEIFAPCDAATRFNVYRNNVAVARIEALKAQFPVVGALVGEEFFAAMARVFALQNPVLSPLLSQQGAGFPDFIGAFAPASELPYLADVARLEWAGVQALNAADRAPLQLARLAAIEPLALLDAHAEFHPAFVLVASVHPIVAIWSAHREDRSAPLDEWRPETAIVVRPEADVVVRACPAGAGAFIAAAAEGASLRDAAEAGLAADATFDFGPALVELVAIGALAGLRQS